MFKNWMESMDHRPVVFLDLDENLIHCADYLYVRPHLKEFLEEINGFADIFILTMSPKRYAEDIMSELGLSDYFMEMFTADDDRDLCSEMGLNDRRCVLVDNRDRHFKYTAHKLDMLGKKCKFIQSKTWIDDKKDTELLSLIPRIKDALGINMSNHAKKEDG
jgi:hypothetical protein